MSPYTILDRTPYVLREDQVVASLDIRLFFFGPTKVTTRIASAVGRRRNRSPDDFSKGHRQTMKPIAFRWYGGLSESSLFTESL